MSSFPPGGRSARILIVDDEAHNRQLLEVMLAPEAYSVVSVASGEAALAQIAEEPPDLVLLDVMMPGMDGYQLAGQLKGNAATKNIPIIMVTALSDRSARMLGLTAGAEDFLSKPVDRSEMCVRIRNLLRLKAFGEYHDRYGQMLEGVVGSRTAELVASERLYRSTFDAAPVGIVHVGLDGHWTRVNQRLCELLGYSREELQTQEVQSLIHSEEDVEGNAESFRLLAARAVDRQVIDEQRLRRRDGTSMWARINISVFRDAEGSPLHFISVLEDITERRNLEAQVRQASKMEAIGGLASGIAHDFNNLLSVILSYSELLAEGLSENDPMRADLGEIEAAGVRAVDLTRQLLAFGRQQVLQPTVVDLTGVVAGMTKMLRRLIGEHVELATGAASARGNIMVDPGQLEQVIMNLSVNARDAMPDGGKLTIETADVELDQAFAADHVGVRAGRHVMLSVTDTGTGMDLRTQARMYEPFFTTKPVGKGTGLGLATVFGIVRQSGGTIWVDSQLREGTTSRSTFHWSTGRRGALSRAHPSSAAPSAVWRRSSWSRMRSAFVSWRERSCESMGTTCSRHRPPGMLSCCPSSTTRPFTCCSLTW